MAYCNLDKRIYEGVGKYNIPEIQPLYEIPTITQWLGFNYCRKEKYCNNNIGVHFYLDDHNFETIWNHPNKYIVNFRKCGITLSPDFSLYTDFPFPIQLYNHYRKHWLARFYQEKGIKVIPTIAWSDDKSYRWCFDGEPKNAIVSIATSGCFADKEIIIGFYEGYEKMLEALTPKKVLCFTLMDKAEKKLKLKGNVEYIHIRRFKGQPA